MRKLWALVITPVFALAFLFLGSAPAQAFGSEVLGCAFNGGTWTANSCAGNDLVQFSPANLSGTYSYGWTIKNPSGATVTTPCSSTTATCLYSGCTTTSSTCTVRVSTPLHDRTYTASLNLTQSGLSRTIQASALVYGEPLDTCPYYPCP